LKIKLDGRHFDTFEVIEADSRTVLNTLTEHVFQDVFKKWQKRWERRMLREGNYFEVDDGPETQS
jgi:predicted ABC-type exoprotein transport system permease subunit